MSHLKPHARNVHPFLLTRLFWRWFEAISVSSRPSQTLMTGGVTVAFNLFVTTRHTRLGCDYACRFRHILIYTSSHSHRRQEPFCGARKTSVVLTPLAPGQQGQTMDRSVNTVNTVNKVNGSTSRELLMWRQLGFAL
jgi:hypothetical protein